MPRRRTDTGGRLSRWPRTAVPASCLIALAVILSPACRGASAQLSSSSACAHFKRPIPVRLSAPDARAGEKMSVELIVPATGQVLERREAPPGDVDLAALFPRLWDTDKPQVLYVQAATAAKDNQPGVRVGPPLVIVPMVAPRYAPKGDRDGFPQLPAAPAPLAPGKPRALAGCWTYTDQRAVITTSKGELTFALRSDAAPNSVRNFRQLIADKFYDATDIHRIASLSGRTLPDIVQFGDPTGTGQGGPGWFIDFEASPLKHGYGTLSYARMTDPNSAGSQVLICLGQQAAPQLNDRYCAFAQMVSGSEALTAIAKTPVDVSGKPRVQVEIKSIRLVDAPPFGSGPEPEKDPLERATGR
jgi:cyclophilin family peptidyl-prolyl cis-trans isomerase